MDLKVLSNQLSKVFNSLGNEWLTKNFETQPFNFRVFVRRGDHDDDLSNYVVEIYTYDLIPDTFRYRENIRKDKQADGMHISGIQNKFLELINYLVPNVGQFKNVFSVKFMDLHPHAYGAMSAADRNKRSD